MFSLLLLNDDGQPVACELLIATDDAQAAMKANVYLQLHSTIPAVEVWDDTRLIRRIHRRSLPARQSA